MIKWTRGELAYYAREYEDTPLGEIVGDILSRGVECVAWDDDREPCEECEAYPGRHTLVCSRHPENAGDEPANDVED